MIGPGKAFDTDRYFVVCTNLLGGCRGTTGPSLDQSRRPAGPTAPTSRSSPSATWCAPSARFLDVLGIERLAAVAGGSLGGMQALEWAVRYPDRRRRHRRHRQHARARSRRAWPGTPSPATRSWPTRTGRAATTTAPAASPTPAWAWRAWSATSPTSRRSRSASKFGRRLQVADDIRYTLTRARVRGRELPAPPGRRVRQALRRQHLSLHLAGADLLRPGPRSTAAARSRARCARRRGAHAADRVQLRLALSAGGFRGAGGGAARATARTSSCTSSRRPTATTASCSRRRARRR